MKMYVVILQFLSLSKILYGIRAFSLHSYLIKKKKAQQRRLIDAATLNIGLLYYAEPEIHFATPKHFQSLPMVIENN